MLMLRLKITSRPTPEHLQRESNLGLLKEYAIMHIDGR